MKVNNSRFEALVFDLGNVLVKIEYIQFLRNTGLDGKYSEEEIFNLLAEPAILYEKGFINSQKFYEEAIRIISVDINYEKFFLAWCSVASDLVEGMDKIIQYLSIRYPLYLLSNTNEAHMNYIMKKFAIMKYFKRYFLSYQIGSMKPEKEIYEYMLNELKIEPNKIYFVDDKLQNIEVAKSLGIISYKFNNSNDLIEDLKENKIME